VLFRGNILKCNHNSQVVSGKDFQLFKESYDLKPAYSGLTLKLQHDYKTTNTYYSLFCYLFSLYNQGSIQEQQQVPDEYKLCPLQSRDFEKGKLSTSSLFLYPVASLPLVTQAFELRIHFCINQCA
jgi:hypothetical protein